MNVELTRDEIHFMCSALTQAMKNHAETSDSHKVLKRAYFKLAAKVTGNA